MIREIEYYGSSQLIRAEKYGKDVDLSTATGAPKVLVDLTLTGMYVWDTKRKFVVGERHAYKVILTNAPISELPVETLNNYVFHNGYSKPDPLDDVMYIILEKYAPGLYGFYSNLREPSSWNLGIKIIDGEVYYYDECRSNTYIKW